MSKEQYTAMNMASKTNAPSMSQTKSRYTAKGQANEEKYFNKQ